MILRDALQIIALSNIVHDKPKAVFKDVMFCYNLMPEEERRPLLLIAGSKNIKKMVRLVMNELSEVEYVDDSPRLCSKKVEEPTARHEVVVHGGYSSDFGASFGGSRSHRVARARVQ